MFTSSQPIGVYVGLAQHTTPATNHSSEFEQEWEFFSATVRLNSSDLIVLPH